MAAPLAALHITTRCAPKSELEVKHKAEEEKRRQYAETMAWTAEDGTRTPYAAERRANSDWYCEMEWVMKSPDCHLSPFLPCLLLTGLLRTSKERRAQRPLARSKQVRPTATPDDTS